MDAINPATDEYLGTYEDDDADAVEAKLETAATTFEEWRECPLREREELLTSAGDVLRENEDRYAGLMTREMGKPISQARSEIRKCAWACDHYAEYASAYLDISKPIIIRVRPAQRSRLFTNHSDRYWQ
jgi:succinate-semialdehyde dehydrogenase/glutarate-semialdehyde dehydrogenase